MRVLCYCKRCWCGLSLPDLYVKAGVYDTSVHLFCPGCRELHAEFAVVEGKP